MSGRRPEPRLVLALMVLAAAAGAFVALVTGGTSATSARAASFDAATVLTPAEPAPAISLHNYLGQPVNLASYHGKAVIVTFMYAHCTTTCPLIASNLRTAENMMSPAERAKVQLLAVSVDPRGDTPKAVAAFLSSHGIGGRMQYLTGSAKELGRVWKAWGVGAERDAKEPEVIDHTGVLYGISASGQRLTVYSPEFKPAAIVHDVPLLAAR